jgi:hypothetical protein
LRILLPVVPEGAPSLPPLLAILEPLEDVKELELLVVVVFAVGLEGVEQLATTNERQYEHFESNGVAIKKVIWVIAYKIGDVLAAVRPVLHLLLVSMEPVASLLNGRPTV